MTINRKYYLNLTYRSKAKFVRKRAILFIFQNELIHSGIIILRDTIISFMEEKNIFRIDLIAQITSQEKVIKVPTLKDRKSALF